MIRVYLMSFRTAESRPFVLAAVHVIWGGRPDAEGRGGGGAGEPLQEVAASRSGEKEADEFRRNLIASAIQHRSRPRTTCAAAQSPRLQ